MNYNLWKSFVHVFHIQIDFLEGTQFICAPLNNSFLKWSWIEKDMNCPFVRSGKLVRIWQFEKHHFCVCVVISDSIFSLY